MKKTIIFILMICFVLGFSACEHKLVMPKKDAESVNKDAGKVMSFDWYYYPTAEELTEIVSDVYIGTVTDISFDVIDLTTGKTADKDVTEDEAIPLLCVIYTIETKNYYKGNQREIVKLKTMGGWAGFKDDEQRAVLDTFENIKKDVVYFDADQFDRLSVGETYVFCTQSLAGGPDYIYNPNQFAFQIDSANAKAVLACVK